MDMGCNIYCGQRARSLSSSHISFIMKNLDCFILPKNPSVSIQNGHLVVLDESGNHPWENLKVLPKRIFPTWITRYAVEIGFGNGEHLVALALSTPTVGYIGCEISTRCIASLVKSLVEKNITNNVLIYPYDGRLLIKKLVEGTIDLAFILFPDPWPKKRHHKRRLLTGDFLKSLHLVMKDGGYIQLATDSQEYSTWINDLIHQVRLLFKVTHFQSRGNLGNGSVLGTKYERKSIKQGLACTYWNLQCV